jgi:iron complex transport system substrate-binding protein
LITTGLALGALALLPACGGRNENRSGSSATPSGTAQWTFTDDRGVAVSLPAQPKRIVAQITGAATLWDYGLRPVGVFGPMHMEDGSKAPQAGDVDIQSVESLGEAWGEFDLEKLAALRPDLVVTQSYSGENALWNIPPEAEPALKTIAPAVSILVRDVSITQPLQRFEQLAKALGANLESSENIAAKTSFNQAVDDHKAAVAEKTGLKVLVISGAPDSLYIANPKAATDLIFYRELGVGIVMPETTEFWETLSWEQANKYPADLILYDNRAGSATLDYLSTIETWRNLPAVRAGQIGPWNTEPTYSYKSYANDVGGLAEAIRKSRAGIA